MARTLLIADDSVTIQRVVELTFSGEDMDVLTAGDGEEAMARIPAERPDIVLADIGMPKRSGYDVAAFVKERPDLRHIPVLLLAGAFEQVDEARVREVASGGVLVKPFEPQQLVARVRALLGIEEPKAAPPPLEFPRREEPEADEPMVPADATPEPVDDVEQVPPSKEPAQPVLEAAPSDEALEDYFNRLDAAFTSREPSPPREPPPEEDPDGHRGVPTLDELVGTPSPEPVPSGNLVADAFTALLAVEEGQPGARPVRLVTTGERAPVVTDALVDEVTRRVIERLAPGAVRDAVATAVSEIAERLVREEIERIRNRQ